MERRTFLKRITKLLGGVFGLLLAAPGVAYLIDPRNRPARPSAFRPVAKLSDLPEPVEGQPVTPTQVVIRDTRRDAWTLHPNEVIGRVWLIRHPDDKVTALTTICPHLGCSINFEDTRRRFVCPCHNGTFHATLDDRLGRRVEDTELGITNPAPRGMDRLETRLVTDEETQDITIEVKFENFIQGLHETKPKT